METLKIQTGRKVRPGIPTENINLVWSVGIFMSVHSIDGSSYPRAEC